MFKPLKLYLSWITSFLLFVCVSVHAQITIQGRVLSQADTKPVANASVFLSNASVGCKTAADGSFLLTGVKPGNYDLVVSIVGFDTYKQAVVAQGSNITLGDIQINPKTVALNEVKIVPKTDPNRTDYYEIFKKEFLGESDYAAQCKIRNPEMLDFVYDYKEDKLTATSADFLVIENNALGYRVKYLLANFTRDNKNNERQLVHYEGSLLFEDLPGSPAQKREWQKRRQAVYEGSPKHFLRAALSNRLDEEGFRVLQYAVYQNPQRPPDAAIDSKISYFKALKAKTPATSDSVSFWEKKKALKKTLTALLKYQLNKADLVSLTDKKGIYALGCENDGLHITYSKDRHFAGLRAIERLNDPFNKDVTLLTFNEPLGYFSDNGVYFNPNAVSYSGAWGRRRMAELLPTDYEPPQAGGTGSAGEAINPGEKLTAYKKSHPSEQVYLHFDKPYYAAGDTIYFKAYLTMGERHEPSQLSGVLHVDLINSSNKIDRSLSLKVANGVCWADLTLPDSLPKGNYRVRAYTNWMRNDDSTHFFERVIAVASPQPEKIAESSSAAPVATPDLQFLPEGGTLVAGLKSRVAFKAIGTNGLGIDVKGTVTDNTGKLITTFSSQHLGMGSFFLQPETARQYKANVTLSDGTYIAVELPPVTESGIGLAINNDSLQKASALVSASPDYVQLNKGREYTLLIYSGGKITTVNIPLDSAQIKLDIAKRRLRTGVNTVTLFSPEGQPLAERLFFVQNYDKLNLAVNSDKTVYSPREKVNVMLHALSRADSAAAGHFSVSIIDEGKVTVDENSEKSILTELLLTDDLKGNIQEPGYYFNSSGGDALKDLDLVMLTHGYRRFEWNKVLADSKPPVWQREQGLEINGEATTMGGKPLANGSVSLLSADRGLVATSLADEHGRFRFANLQFPDSARFVLQAAAVNGSNKTQLKYKPLMGNVPLVGPMPGTLPVVNQQYAVYLANVKERLEYAKLDHSILLKEVKIREQKIRNNYRSSNLGGPGYADQVLHMDDMGVPPGGQLTERLNGLLRGITFNNGFATFLQDTMLIIVDGVRMPGGFRINDLGNDVETVEVLKYASTAIYGFDAGHGVLVFTTKIGKLRDVKDIPSFGILPIYARGYYTPRTFYLPRYDVAGNGGKKKDLRSTIYWNPEVITDKDGNATFDFYNADAAGSYRVVVEGMDDKGNLGRQVYRYLVK